MKIKKVLYAPGTSGFFFDDQRAIKMGAEHDGFTYIGNPVTPGFRRIRKAGECVSVMLLLENDRIARGDCAAVQYSGTGGRDPLFLSETYIPFMEKYITPNLEGITLTTFKEMANSIDSMLIDEKKHHTAIRYGISQALLSAISLRDNKLQCEVICEEYNLPIVTEPIPIFAQSGDDRYNNVDKMILKEADVLPHGLINNINDKLGKNGEKLIEYIEWIKNRIKLLRYDSSYHPSIHIDVYGTIGIIFDYDKKAIVEYLASLQKYADDFELYIEGPVDMEGKENQIEILANITGELKKIGSPVKIVADEWCNTFEDIKDFTDAKACHMVQIKTPDLGGIQNTVESILYCKKNNMEAYQGGTCNETEISSQNCVHIAMAARPERILAKPGMGFDEGFTIVKNEMSRIMAIQKYKSNC